jgi:hypothetical protein
MKNNQHIQLNTAQKARAGRTAFSIMEVVAMVALLGILSYISISSLGSSHQTFVQAKLEADVATLNRAVAMYQADGGNLSGLTSEPQVLDRLKSIRQPTQRQQHTNVLSGRAIDPRLVPISSTSVPVGGLVASWNSNNSRFELTNATSGIVGFELDNSLASQGFVVDSSRSVSNLQFNQQSYTAGSGINSGWVWGNNSIDTIAYNAPTSTSANGKGLLFDPNKLIPPSTGTGGSTGGGSGTGGGGGGGTGTGTGGGSGGGTTTPPQPSKLKTPTIQQKSSNAYAYSAFPSSVSITSGVTQPGVSRLEYRIDGGPWQTYSGPVPISPTQKLEARNVALDTANWKDSDNATATYNRLAQNLNVNLNATWGNAIGGSGFVSTINNTTPGEVSVIHGDTQFKITDNETLDSGEPNKLIFKKGTSIIASPSNSTNASDNLFTLGELDIVNGTTYYDKELTKITLSMDINLQNPPMSKTVQVEFGWTATSNDFTREEGADILDMKPPVTDFKFNVDGIEYKLEISWQKLSSNGVFKDNKFYIEEGSSARAVIQGRFVANK